jgi:IS5 family transposase
MREIERQVTEPTEKLVTPLETARRVHARQRHDKNKVYSVHEPEVECIAKPGPRIPAHREGSEASGRRTIL